MHNDFFVFFRQKKNGSFSTKLLNWAMAYVSI